MQILISVIINIIILAVALPLFYIYIVSRARERLERETTSKARDEIEALVKEFNNIALSRISILEDAINRANELLKKINDNEENKNGLNIKIEDKENIENIKPNIEKEEIKKNEIQITENKLKKESREELRNKLDMVIKNNINIKTENKNDNAENEKTINENIIKLYKEGFSKEQISKKLNCAITEIDIVIDIENIKR